MPTSTRPTYRYWPGVMTVYAASVYFFALLGAVLVKPNEPDADIGGTACSLVVAVAGLPWSVGPFLSREGLDGTLSQALMLAACAIFNGVLVLCGALVVRRRRL